MKIRSKNKSIIVFKPIELEINITIENEKEFFDFKKEFKNANLEGWDICSGDSGDRLNLITELLRNIENCL